MTFTPGSITRPQAFPGTPEQAAANRRTHYFDSEARCMDCDCRSFSTCATWPCGADVPRETVPQGSPPLSVLEALSYIAVPA